MVDRESVPARLAMKFADDCEKVMKHYTIEEQLELYKYLRELFRMYLEGTESTKENLKWMEDEIERLQRKLGQNYKHFMFGGILKYLVFDFLLATKDIYTREEFNTLKGGEQILSASEKAMFLDLAMRVIKTSITDLYLQSPPEGEAALKGKEEEKTETIRSKGKIKREREDNLTRLNQEQTTLLVHFLQAGKIILRDEYLNNKEAGQAFSVLTGYSADSIRQNLSETELKRISNKKNLDSLSNALTSLQLLIDKERKEKK